MSSFACIHAVSRCFDMVFCSSEEARLGVQPHRTIIVSLFASASTSLILHERSSHSFVVNYTGSGIYPNRKT